nr:MAG TPA: hypothetical protein [Bacteriophage sp.]DAJ60450.1 MAG TPA: hypothetical protein [Caudoviricetes sp.]DAJ72784.1 MAG TPA: hypothetical protein [Caudoviricetes sp.]
MSNFFFRHSITFFYVISVTHFCYLDNIIIYILLSVKCFLLF